MKNLLSVIICTYNREVLLQRCLDSFTKVQVTDDFDWELIVVNNNSTDRTSGLIQSFSPLLPIKEVVETKQGLSFARNTGIQRAKGNYIIFTDDDMQVGPDHLTAYNFAFVGFPEIRHFGGQIKSNFQTSPIKIIEDNLKMLGPNFALIDLDRPIGIVRDKLYFGGNMAFKKEVFEKLSFDVELGFIKGGNLLGEDTVICEELLKSGDPWVWVPDAFTKHFIPSERATLEYVRYRQLLFGRTVFHLAGKRKYYLSPLKRSVTLFLSTMYLLFSKTPKSGLWLKCFLRKQVDLGFLKQYWLEIKSLFKKSNDLA